MNRCLQKGGVKADELKVRFSTKYSDDESGLYFSQSEFEAAPGERKK